jgi:hypothetical protein
MTVPAAATRLTPVSATADARGLAAASTAFVIWGVLPLYLKQLQHVPALQITGVGEQHPLYPRFERRQRRVTGPIKDVLLELRGQVIEPAKRIDRQPDREAKRAVASWRFDQIDNAIGDFL